MGEGHFRRVVAEYVEHYHAERNHQGIGNRLISGPRVIQMTGRVPRRPRLGAFCDTARPGATPFSCKVDVLSTKVLDLDTSHGRIGRSRQAQARSGNEYL